MNKYTRIGIIILISLFLVGISIAVGMAIADRPPEEIAQDNYERAINQYEVTVNQVKLANKNLCYQERALSDAKLVLDVYERELNNEETLRLRTKRDSESCDFQ